ncbi:Alpha/Beta hydrolase protein [Mycena sp. CBHHK59/15]|nr:Alpha/Beta hydrolase protein [Mycena sp. CBHHK59/15]
MVTGSVVKQPRPGPGTADKLRRLNRGPLTPLHLSSVSPDEFTSLSHSRFPNHRVRVKQSAFCDPTVNVYTGYLDVDQGAKHLFFYFFESRRDPAKGPCSIDMKNVSSNGTIWNPYSWNAEANIFFLDQPVGVGFSYADFGETIETTEDAAKNVHAFITIFFETFSQFAGRALHLSGESYGWGRYLPVFASEIHDQNQLAISEGRPTINLQSVIIGNGITDISTLYPGRYEVECGRAALDIPFQSISTCVRMKTSLPRCQRDLYAGCIDQFDAINCRAAVNFCDSELSTGMWASGRNVYDISKMCVGDGLCYEENGVITKFLSDPAMRALLGVDPAAANFTSCSSDVGRLFNVRLDKWAVPTQHYVAGLLEHGCNWVANRMWVDKLEWSGREAYNALGWADWGVGEGKSKAGEVKQWEGGLLSFVTIRGAGHMMSRFLLLAMLGLTPAEALAMLSAWLHGKQL